MPYWGPSPDMSTLLADVAALKAEGSILRSCDVPLPLLGVGNTDVSVVWDVSAMPSADYKTMWSLEGGVAVFGKVTAMVKSGTQTASGVTMTLTNSGVAAIAVGAGVLHVVAYVRKSG